MHRRDVGAASDSEENGHQRIHLTRCTLTRDRGKIGDLMKKMLAKRAEIVRSTQSLRLSKPASSKLDRKS